MNDLKEVSTLILANRLNEIMVLTDNLKIKQIELLKEYDEIVYELWRRIPSLKDDVNIQPKLKKKIIDKK